MSLVKLEDSEHVKYKIYPWVTLFLFNHAKLSIPAVTRDPYRILYIYRNIHSCRISILMRKFRFFAAVNTTGHRGLYFITVGIYLLLSWTYQQQQHWSGFANSPILLLKSGSFVISFESGNGCIEATLLSGLLKYS